MLHVRLSGNQEKENVAFDERPEWRGLLSACELEDNYANVHRDSGVLTPPCYQRVISVACQV